MTWKHTLAIFSMLATSACLAQDGITDAEHLHQLLAKAIERNRSHAKTSSQEKPKTIFDPLLEKIQQRINAHINRLTASSKAETPGVSTEEDFKHLHHLWAAMPKIHGEKTIASYADTILKRAESNLGAVNDETAKRAILQDAWESIGEVIFLAHRCPEKVSQLIQLSSPIQSKQSLQTQASQEIQTLVNECNAYAALQQQAGIQNPNLSLSMCQPLVIAGALLTPDGKINFGIIPQLRQAFVPATAPLDYQVGMDRVLASMNSSWQPLLDAIVAANDSASQEVVLAELGLSRGTQLTDLHSKTVALKAILSQLNQGATGDCFAVAWAIKKHDEYFAQSMQDYAALLQNGFLTRTANGAADQFFFLNQLADADLQNTIVLHSSGALGNGGVMVWDAPGIASACRQMGIDNPQNAAQAALSSLFTNGDPAQVTPQDVITSYANWSAQNTPNTDAGVQLTRGLYGFSVTQNRLLRAWETALAGMAEATTGDYIHDQVIATINQALIGQWNALLNQLTPQEHPLIIQMQTSFAATLSSLNRFVYDAAIPLSQTAADGSSSDGGFQLYQRDPTNIGSIGQRVATPNDFQNYLVNVINQTATAMSQADSQDASLIAQIANTIASYIQGNTFMTAVLTDYNSSNAQVANPVANYQTLQMTPMTSLCGDNPFAVEGLDTGVSFSPDTMTVDPSSPYDLVRWILNLASWKEQTQHYLEDNIPDELDPATSPQHAFNIAFDDADIKAFVTSNLTSDQWLQQKVVQPNMAIASGTMDSHTKSLFSSNFISWLGQNFQLSSSDLAYLNQAITSFNQKPMTMQVYMASFLSLIAQAFQLDANNTKELSVVFDSIFIQCLPANTIQQLSQTALRFAMTNWDDGPKNIYFCVYFNPRTGTLAFGSIDEDRTALMPMDEYQWIDQQQWEVVPVDEPAGSAN